MKCQEVCAVLEEYFDGELDERQSHMVAAHINACADCTAAHAALQREQDLLMRYERDVEVKPALWHGIAARIAADKLEAAPLVPTFGARVRGWLAGTLTGPRFSPALTAALVAVAVGLTVGVMKFTGRSAVVNPSVATVQPPQPAPATTKIDQAQPASVAHDATAASEPQREPQVTTVNAERQLAVAPKKREARRDKARVPDNGLRLEQANLQTPPVKQEQTAEALVREAEQKYQKAIEILARDVNQRRARFDPATLARFDDTLKALDRTIAETRRAALGQGNDPVAVQYMLTAYAKKVEVLREMSRN